MAEGIKIGTKNQYINEEEACRNLRANINTIIKQNNIKTKKEFAEATGLNEATFSNFMKGKNDKIPNIYPFFMEMSSKFGYSMEQLILTRISDIAPEPDYDVRDWNSITGLYQTYYYDTSCFEGREYLPDGKALRYGLLLIYKVENSDERKVVALFGLSRQQMTFHFNKISECCKTKSLFNTGTAYNYLKESIGDGHLYMGTVELLDEFFAIHLGFKNLDRASMLFYRPKGTGEQYVGGLGQVLSVSRGRNVTPCSQLLGLSRYEVTVSDEEVAQSLILNPPDIVVNKHEVMNLVNLLQNGFNDVGKRNDLEDMHLSNSLSADQKMILAVGVIKKLVMDIVCHNIFRINKLFGGNDNDFYHFIKSNRH